MRKLIDYRLANGKSCRSTKVLRCIQRAMSPSELCKEIMQMDPKIRFAGICDETGEIKYGGMREGLKPLLSPDETKNSMKEAFARWGTRNTLATKLGKARYAMAEYEKTKRITLPLDDPHHLLLVSTAVEADHTRIIDNILKLKTNSTRLS
jgi:hypothetical protein